MTKLLRANFRRLRKSGLFWLCIAFMFGITVVAIIAQYRTSLEFTGFTVTLDGFVFGYTTIIGIVLAVFCSLFLGTEYSDGTIRNKLIVGHKRITIYFAALITSIMAAFIMCVAFLVAVFVVGIPFFGFLTIGAAEFAAYLLGSLVMICAVSSVLTAICTLITSKAIVAIVNILCMIGLLFFAIDIQSRLSEPEFYSNVMFSVDGELQVPDEGMPNPRYLSGTKRAVYENLFDILPTGQAMQYSGMSAKHLWRLPLYSLSIIIISTWIGVFFFRRKDLK